ncbi:hypothetical protein TK49_23355 (plasmid) [Ralstonia mannitolilytica]|nr:hypothetical protein TK49_23355 [Ralstonia mannitolilytica]
MARAEGDARRCYGSSLFRGDGCLRNRHGRCRRFPPRRHGARRHDFAAWRDGDTCADLRCNTGQCLQTRPCLPGHGRLGVQTDDLHFILAFRSREQAGNRLNQHDTLTGRDRLAPCAIQFGSRAPHLHQGIRLLGRIAGRCRGGVLGWQGGGDSVLRKGLRRRGVGDAYWRNHHGLAHGVDRCAQAHVIAGRAQCCTPVARGRPGHHQRAGNVGRQSDFPRLWNDDRESLVDRRGTAENAGGRR